MSHRDRSVGKDRIATLLAVRYHVRVSLLIFAMSLITENIAGADSCALGPSLRAIGEAHEENRESFRRFACTYRFRSGTAKTMQDALDGMLTQVTTSKVIWAKDGEFERSSVTVDPETQLTTRQESPDGRHVLITTPIADRQFLSSDAFSVNAPGGAATLFPKSEGMTNGIPHPFNPGMFDYGYRRSPGAIIRTHPPIEFRILPARPDGNIGVEWTMATETRQFGRTEYHFDSVRGFALRRLERESGGLRTVLVVPLLKEFSGGRWFPMRVIRIKGNSPFSVWDFDVESLKVDPPRRELDLEIELPSGTQVNQADRPGGYFTLQEPLRIQPKDLQRLWDRCDGLRAERTAAVEPRKSHWRFWFIAIGITSVIVSGWLLWPRLFGTSR